MRLVTTFTLTFTYIWPHGIQNKSPNLKRIGTVSNIMKLVVVLTLAALASAQPVPNGTDQIYYDSYLPYNSATGGSAAPYDRIDYDGASLPYNAASALFTVKTVNQLFDIIYSFI